MAQVIGETNCNEISICDNTSVEADSNLYFYTSSMEGPTVDIIEESAVFLKLDDGSQILCNLIDGNEQEKPEEYELIGNAEDIEKNVIDGNEKGTVLLVDGSSGRDELVCFTENGKRSYVCQIEGCERRYTSRNYLKTHQRNHTGERPFKCDECNTAFNTDYALKVHRRRHTGDKPYLY